MVDLAVVIVTWNNSAVIADALRSLLDDLSDSGLKHEVRVLDCASSDDTVDLIRRGFPEVNLLACEDNVGYARGNNLAIRALGFEAEAPGPQLPTAVYLLNPDTITRKGATRTLFDLLFAETSTGVVGARLTFADGSFQHSAFMFPDLRQIWAEFFPTPGRWLEGSFNGRYPKRQYQAKEPFAVDFTLGATMMLKRDVIVEVGLLDEDFFMYCEEVDWAWRIRRAGWQILCVPRAHVTHIGGGSTSQARPRSLLNLWKSRLTFYDKHYPRWKRWLARQLIVRGMKGMITATPAAESEMIAACRQVVELARS